MILCGGGSFELYIITSGGQVTVLLKKYLHGNWFNILQVPNASEDMSFNLSSLFEVKVGSSSNTLF